MERELRRGLPLLATAVTAMTTVAAMAVGGCSASGGNPPGAPRPSGSSGTPGSSNAVGSPGTVAAGGTPGGAGRPADACTMLTSAQVTAAVGTPGPYTGAHEDPADDGSPVWGCTWGTPDSSADVRELRTTPFVNRGPGEVSTPVTGIGDKAVLTKRASDGSMPYVYFAAGGRYYAVEVTVDRRENGAANAPREEIAEQVLAETLAHRLAG